MLRSGQNLISTKNGFNIIDGDLVARGDGDDCEMLEVVGKMLVVS